MKASRYISLCTCKCKLFAPHVHISNLSASSLLVAHALRVEARTIKITHLPTGQLECCGVSLRGLFTLAFAHPKRSLPDLPASASANLAVSAVGSN